MDTIDFPERNVIIAKDQPQFRPIPAHVARDGVVTCCWKLTEDELERVLVTGCIWHQIHSCGQPLQPQLLSAAKPIL